MGVIAWVKVGVCGWFCGCTVLHRKRLKTTFFNILCIYSVMVHGSGTSFILN